MRKKRFRFLNRFYANLKGYFWLPCPICNEMFGGHEWAWTLKKTISTGSGVCPDCVKKAKQYNLENFGTEI